MASSSSVNSPKKLIVRTADDHLFDVEESVALEIGAVKTYFEDNSATVMPLPNVSAAVLNRIITFCKKQLEFRANSTPKNEVLAFNTEFLKDETNDMVKELILAAKFLEVKEFLEVLLDSVYMRIQNKSVEWTREFFNIENDFTPEEEAAARKEYAWAFEGRDED